MKFLVADTKPELKNWKVFTNKTERQCAYIICQRMPLPADKSMARCRKYSYHFRCWQNFRFYNTCTILLLLPKIKFSQSPYRPNLLRIQNLHCPSLALLTILYDRTLFLIPGLFSTNFFVLFNFLPSLLALTVS